MGYSDAVKCGKCEKLLDPLEAHDCPGKAAKASEHTEVCGCAQGLPTCSICKNKRKQETHQPDEKPYKSCINGDCYYVMSKEANYCPRCDTLQSRPERESGTQWQPIETAPEDVDLLTTKTGQQIPVVASYTIDEGGSDWYSFNGYFEKMFKKEWKPEYWMPLPRPPEDDRRRGSDNS